MSKIELITGILLMFLGLYMIVYYSNWQTAVGIYIIVISNNIGLKTKYKLYKLHK